MMYRENCRSDNMNVIFCRPELTMQDSGDAILFFDECNAIIEKYIYNFRIIASYEIMRIWR